MLVFFLIVEAFGAPAGDVSIEGKTFATHKTFSLRIALYWEGDEERYEIRSHRLDLPAGIEEKGVSSSALGGTDGHKVVFIVQLAGHEEGQYTIDPIEVDYREKGKEEVFTKRLPGVSFTVAEKPIFGTRNQWMLVGIGLLIFIGLFFGIFVRESRRSKKGDSISASDRATQTLREQLSKRLEECRKAKTEGDLDRFFAAALQLHKEMATFLGDSAEKNEVTEMEKVAERAKYGGVKPGSEVIEKYLRALERAVKHF